VGVSRLELEGEARLVEQVAEVTEAEEGPENVVLLPGLPLWRVNMSLFCGRKVIALWDSLRLFRCICFRLHFIFVLLQK
jgi:hypothetical protein